VQGSEFKSQYRPKQNTNKQEKPTIGVFFGKWSDLELNTKKTTQIV
jgi:hypothetical protein